MRAGLATPQQVAIALGLSLDTVLSWRRRAGIDTSKACQDRVNRLFARKPRIIPVIDDPDAAPF